MFLEMFLDASTGVSSQPDIERFRWAFDVLSQALFSLATGFFKDDGLALVRLQPLWHPGIHHELQTLFVLSEEIVKQFGFALAKAFDELADFWGGGGHRGSVVCIISSTVSAS